MIPEVVCGLVMLPIRWAAIMLLPLPNREAEFAGHIAKVVVVWFEFQRVVVAAYLVISAAVPEHTQIVAITSDSPRWAINRSRHAIIWRTS